MRHLRIGVCHPDFNQYLNMAALKICPLIFVATLVKEGHPFAFYVDFF